MTGKLKMTLCPGAMLSTGSGTRLFPGDVVGRPMRHQRVLLPPRPGRLTVLRAFGPPVIVVEVRLLRAKAELVSECQT